MLLPAEQNCPFESKLAEDITLHIDQQWLCQFPCPCVSTNVNASELSFVFLELLRRYGGPANIYCLQQ
jgi:hypothetical protein